MNREVVEGLITIARDDLGAARLLLDQHPRGAGFHLQQAAEKMLKAVLSAEDVDYPLVHRITALAELLSVGHPWRVEFVAFDFLTEYTTALRYLSASGVVPTPSPEHDLCTSHQQLVALLPEVERWCAARLGEEP